MKARIQRFPKIGLTVLCILSLLASLIPLGLQLKPQAAGSTAYTRQELDFEDSEPFGFSKSSALSIDGMTDSDGYLYGENLSDTAQSVEISCPATVQKTNTVSFDFLIGSMPSEGNLIFTAEFTDGSQTLSTREFKAVLYPSTEKWYHFEEKIVPNTADVQLKLSLTATASVVFDNMAIAGENGTPVALDAETAAGNALYFDWVFKGSEAASTNPVLHLTNPIASKGGVSRYYAMNLNDGTTSIKESLLVNKSYTLRFDYYYVDNGYDAKNIATETVKVRLADTATSLTGSINTSFDMSTNVPKFDTWHTFETTFVAKNRKTTNLAIEIGAGIEMYIDNIEFVDEGGNTVLSANFNTKYTISVSGTTPASTYAIENGPAVLIVDDWALMLKNSSTSPSYCYVEDYDLSTELDSAKSYYLEFETFIARNAKTTVNNAENKTNFDVQIGGKTVFVCQIGDAPVDEWTVLKSGNFTPGGASVNMRAYCGVTAYVDNIKIVDAATDKTVLTYTIRQINSTEATKYGAGEMVNRRTVRAGMSKNNVLHVNTPVKSKLDHILDIRINTPTLPDILQLGHEYQFTCDLYYFDNGYTDVYDGGQMHNNLPTFRVGTGNGNFCEVFRNDRRTYMGVSKGHPYEQWLKITGGWYGQGLSSDEHATFTRVESTKNNIYYSSMGLKVWCGTEVLVDNMKIIDVETGLAVYTIDFEDELDYVCFDESISDSAQPPKGTFVIEGGPEVNYGDGPTTIDYAATATADTVNIYDSEFENLEPDTDYRISFNYYMESAGSGDTLFELHAIKKWSAADYELNAKVTAGTKRQTGRWEKAAFVGKVSDYVDGLALVAASGTSVFVDDIVITDIKTGAITATLSFTSKTDIRSTTDKVIGSSDDAPSKAKMITVSEPKGLSMGYLRAAGGTDAANSGMLGAVNGQISVEPGCKYDIEFEYYQARTAASGKTLFTAEADSSVIPSGMSTNCLTVYNTQDGVWTTASCLVEISSSLESVKTDWLRFNLPAGALVYIDNLSVTKHLEDTNIEVALLDFETEESEKFFTAGNTAKRLTKAEILEKGFKDNGSEGYLYLSSDNQSEAIFYELKNIKLKDNTSYAVTFNYCSKENTGDNYAFILGYQHIQPEVGGVTKNHRDYYNKIDEGWSSRTVYFTTDEVVPAANYLEIGLYKGYELIFDNIEINEVVEPKPQKETVLTFDKPDSVLYPAVNGFRQISNTEVKQLYPELADAIGDSEGFLMGYSSEPRMDRALNYDIHGIALRSNSEYNINVQYMVLDFDTNPDDEYTFNHYCALGSNYGNGSWQMKTFVSNIVDHEWRTMSLSIVTEDVESGIAYFVIPMYYGCSVLFDNFTVTEAANYSDNLYCEELYSQLENNDFESEITDSNWGPLSDGMKIVSDSGDSNRKANKHVLEIDGEALGGSTYSRSFNLITNTNYILSMWVKAEPDSDVTVGVYGNRGGTNFKDLFLTEDGNIPFERDGKWHRVNIAFGSGIFDEGFLNITGTGGKIWIDDVDLYLASQGTSSAGTQVAEKTELVFTDALGLPLKRFVEKTIKTTEQRLVDEECYRTDTIVTPYTETTTTKKTYRPEIGKKMIKSVKYTGGEWGIGAYICIIAIIILLLSLAAFFVFLFVGKRKNNNQDGGAAQ